MAIARIQSVYGLGRMDEQLQLDRDAATCQFGAIVL